MIFSSASAIPSSSKASVIHPRVIVCEMPVATLAATFLWAALAKSVSPETAERFAAATLSSDRPRTVVSAIVLAEWGLAFALMTGYRKRAMLIGTGLLIAAMSALLWLARTQGFQGGCGCFGGSGQSSVSASLLRNGILLVICAVGLVTIVPQPRRSGAERRKE